MSIQIEADDQIIDEIEEADDQVDLRNSEVKRNIEKGSWVIMEIFGHKVVAGYMQRDEFLGAPMIRLDVPATSGFPSFTRHYHPNAIYSVTYVSEEAARMTAESLEENPVSVYVPELGDLRRMQEENEKMRKALERIQKAQLNSGF